MVHDAMIWDQAGWWRDSYLEISVDEAGDEETWFAEVMMVRENDP